MSLARAGRSTLLVGATCGPAAHRLFDLPLERPGGDPPGRVGVVDTIVTPAGDLSVIPAGRCDARPCRPRPGQPGDLFADLKEQFDIIVDSAPSCPWPTRSWSASTSTR
ncbi:MAG: hypothetical protein WKF75_19370 [Singulisphaera sp.]